jgi:adenosylcobinamide-GDP ribazoletransferase
MGMESFWVALRFLTVLPVPRGVSIAPEAAGSSLLAYPVVGLVVGLGLVLVAGLADWTSAPLQAALVVAAWALLSGALHLDGLADSADAFLGGHGDASRTLSIMKDPRSGPAGVVAVTLVLLIKYAALAPAVPWGALIAAPVLGRTAVLALFLTTPYVRPGGLGQALSRHLPGDHGWLVLGLVALALPLLFGWRGLALLLVLAAAGYAARKALVHRIGGTTGDTAGAVVELAEVISLAVLAGGT